MKSKFLKFLTISCGALALSVAVVSADEVKKDGEKKCPNCPDEKPKASIEQFGVIAHCGKCEKKDAPAAPATAPAAPAAPATQEEKKDGEKKCPNCPDEKPKA
ncbi:MAG: hypothetical protein D4R66_01035 [Opitutales bacterium]|jgi:hypothetical protein|nr:MAG: hypothetical protein D4R66_01035 [Opitutales bacterium]